MTISKHTGRYIGIIAVLLVLIVVVVAFHKHFYFRSPVIFLPQSQQAIVTDKGHQVSLESANSFNNVKEVSGGTAANAFSYEAAYRLYQGRIVQLDQNCRAQPVTILIPPQTVIMLGNDSQWQRAVTVGPHMYSIAPYDYVLASFNTAGNFVVNCDSVQSVAIISVQ